jgi:hypothetical protein
MTLLSRIPDWPTIHAQLLENSMSRNLDHLSSVFGDLESRYGSDDEIVMEMKTALENRQGDENTKSQRLVATQDQQGVRGSIKRQPGRGSQDSEWYAQW